MTLFQVTILEKNKNRFKVIVHFGKGVNEKRWEEDITLEDDELWYLEKSVRDNFNSAVAKVVNNYMDHYM